MKHDRHPIFPPERSAGISPLLLPKHPILVIGSSNTDMIIKADRIPKAGETILGGEFSSVPGGKGANQAVAAARAGGAVTFITRIGQDIFGKKAVAGLAAEGINVRQIIRDKKSPSGVALIFVSKSGENSIAVASGANARMTPADVHKAAGAFRVASILLLQLEIPLKTVEAAVAQAVASGVRVILNPAPAQSLPTKLLQSIYLLTPNETEAELLTGIKINSEATAARAARKLISRGVRNVIITLGAKGAFLGGKDVWQNIPGHKVKAVDATGAGDVFNGTLAVALAEGKALPEAARFACAAAAVSVTRLGAQASAPKRAIIEKMLTKGSVPKTK